MARLAGRASVGGFAPNRVFSATPLRVALLDESYVRVGQGIKPVHKLAVPIRLGSWMAAPHADALATLAERKELDPGGFKCPADRKESARQQ
jgi:hypothetical protein